MKSLPDIVDYYAERSGVSPDVVALMARPMVLIDPEDPEQYVRAEQVRLYGLPKDDATTLRNYVMSFSAVQTHGIIDGYASADDGEYVGKSWGGHSLVRSVRNNLVYAQSAAQINKVLSNTQSGLLAPSVRTGTVTSLMVRACMPEELIPVPRVQNKSESQTKLPERSAYFQIVGDVSLGKRRLGTFAAGICTEPHVQTLDPSDGVEDRVSMGFRLAFKRSSARDGSSEQVIRAISQQAATREAVARTNASFGTYPNTKW